MCNKEDSLSCSLTIPASYRLFGLFTVCNNQSNGQLTGVAPSSVATAIAYGQQVNFLPVCVWDDGRKAEHPKVQLLALIHFLEPERMLELGKEKERKYQETAKEDDQRDERKGELVR